MAIESHCETVQLQIDDYLDRELGRTQEKRFLLHAALCAECAAQLQYASALHRAVTSLPMLDSQAAPAPRRQARLATSIQGLLQRLRHAPVFASGALAGVSLVALSLLALSLLLLQPQPAAPGLAGVPATPIDTPVLPRGGDYEGYSQEEIVRAIEDMQLAIATLQDITQRTGTLIEGHLLLDNLRRPRNAVQEEDIDTEARPNQI